MGVKHIYVHIPFCRARCGYCDFASEALRPGEARQRMEAYLERLRAELGDSLGLISRPVETIYVGGGTPTVLPADLLCGLVDGLAALARAPASCRSSPGPTSISASVEFTVEANPGTIDEDLLGRLATAGVTRLSLGIQSFSPRLRHNLQRQVTQAEVDDCLATLHRVGWREWNLDLIHGIPGQTREEAVADLDLAVAAGPTHISLYDLTYTPEYREKVAAALGADVVEQAEKDAEEHYAEASARLEAAGYRRYEVSNYALPGYESLHNSAYWRGEDYLGLGAGAVSTIGLERRTGPSTVADFIAGVPPEIERLSDRTRLWEKAMLSLRTRDGIVISEVEEVIDEEAMERLVCGGYLECRYDRLCVDPRFLDLSNSIISSLLVSSDESLTTGPDTRMAADDATHR